MHITDLRFLNIAHTIAAYILESNEGPVLIETGPYSTFPQLEAGLHTVGYRVEDVQHVLLTHIHLDHAGAAWAFAQNGAQIYVHPFGKKHLAKPEKLLSSARRIYQDMMDQLWGEMQPIAEEQITTVPDEGIITIGNLELRAHHTPGHAVHHIAWQVANTIFTGDVAGVRIDGGMVVPPCPPPDIHIEDWDRSIERLRGLKAQQFMLTHYGAVTDREEHLNALQDRLHRWAEWMQPHAEAGRTVGEVAPDFEAYVRKELSDSGLDQKAIQQYDAANPPWMSVAGLLRYWKKKAESEP